MADSASEALQLARAGRADDARAMVERIAAAEPANAEIWIAAVVAAREAGDTAAERRALTELLRREPRNLDALLARGDLSRGAGDAREAVRFYTTALNVAAATPPPPQLHAALNAAQQFVMATQAEFTQAMAAAIADAGIDATGMPRVAGAIDLLFGRRELYVQQPSMFYFPEMPQRPFFAREEFEWVAAVESAAPAIRAELNAILADGDGFAPYVQTSDAAPPPANHLRDDTSWGAFHLFEGGKPHPVNAARCPATMAALAGAPMPAVGIRSPMALFSRLRPGTHIAPHHGVFNTRLICHLPLIVPDGCGIRVGAETREWREGELLIFDDSFEHEAWNRGTADRIVLLFEVWRPELSATERDAVAALLGAVERQGVLAGVTD